MSAQSSFMLSLGDVGEFYEIMRIAGGESTKKTLSMMNLEVTNIIQLLAFNEDQEAIILFNNLQLTLTPLLSNSIFVAKSERKHSHCGGCGGCGGHK